MSFSTLIDGADMASAVNPWQAYIGLAGDTVSDVQIKTAGMDASTPLGYGAAVSAVTQSGTNEFRGNASFAYTPKKWIANNQPGGSPQTMSVVQPDVALGGPITRDRLWFYGSYRRRSGTLGISRAPADVATLQAFDPSFVPFDNEIHANIVFAKVSGQLSPAQRFSTFYSYDATPYNQNGAFAVDNFSHVTLGGHGYAARLDSAWNPWWTSQFGFSWNNKAVRRRLVHPEAVSQRVFRTAVPSAGQLLGTSQFGLLNGEEFATRSPYAKWTITADSTMYRSGWLGSHEIQFGISLQPHMTREDTIIYTNGGVSLEDLVLRNVNNPAAGAIPFRRVIYDVPGGVGEVGAFRGQHDLRTGRLAAHAPPDGQPGPPRRSRDARRRPVRRARPEQHGSGAAVRDQLHDYVGPEKPGPVLDRTHPRVSDRESSDGQRGGELQRRRYARADHRLPRGVRPESRRRLRHDVHHTSRVAGQSQSHHRP